jgi:hypothetical protein
MCTQHIPARLFLKGIIQTLTLRENLCQAVCNTWRVSRSQARELLNIYILYIYIIYIYMYFFHYVYYNLVIYIISDCIAAPLHSSPSAWSPVQMAIALSSGGRAILCEHRGDWKWVREAYALRCHWTAKDCCHLCTARNPSDPIRYNRYDPYKNKYNII